MHRLVRLWNGRLWLVFFILQLLIYIIIPDSSTTIISPIVHELGMADSTY